MYPDDEIPFAKGFYIGIAVMKPSRVSTNPTLGLCQACNYLTKPHGGQILNRSSDPEGLTLMVGLRSTTVRESFMQII